MKVNAKYVVFSAIALASTYVLYHNERFLVDSSHPAWQHYAPFKWWLLPHGIFGAIVLLFAPLQFSDRLRKRFTRAHRIMGRLYVVGAILLAPLGAYIQYYQERMGAPRSFTILAIVDAAMLMGATASHLSSRSDARSRCIDSGPRAAMLSRSSLSPVALFWESLAGKRSESRSCRRLSGDVWRFQFRSQILHLTGESCVTFQRLPNQHWQIHRL